MIFILLVVGFLVVTTLALVGFSLAWNGKSVRYISLKDMVKNKNKNT